MELTKKEAYSRRIPGKRLRFLSAMVIDLVYRPVCGFLERRSI